MIEGLDREFANLARLVNPARLRDKVQEMVDAFDGDGGAANDERQQELNKVYFSPSVGGRGALNGSLDAELSRLVDAAFNAEMEVLKLKDDPRTPPQLRAEALAAMARRTLDHHDTGTRRRRGHPHVIITRDMRDLEPDHPDLVATIRSEASCSGSCRPRRSNGCVVTPRSAGY